VAARTRLELGGVRWWLSRNTEREAARELLQTALDALRSGAARNLKTGRRKQLYPLDLRASGRPDHFLKVNDYRAAAGMRRLLRGSKARHELEMAEQVAGRGIPTPIPLAAGERRKGGRLRSCYLLMPILEEAVDLRRLWLEGKLPPRERHALVTAFGALSRQAHDAGVFQDDFAPNNFLVRRGFPPEFFMIDFERAQLRTANDEAARRFMLAKIDRELAGAPAGDRMRFLRAYSSGDRAEAGRWWHRVEGFAPALARRDFARIRRNATRPGRRFRRLVHGAWRGYARVGVEDDPLLEALPEGRASGAQVRVDAVGDLWRVQYSGLRRSQGRRIWVTANFLWTRGGLCPRPLGVWSRGDQMVLLLERRAGVQPLTQCPDRRSGLAAVRVLLDRILALGEIREPPLSESLLIEKGEVSALRASLAAPHGVRVTGRVPSDRRERGSELINALRG
jgi:tRNA A-37 threonylcarbamoyl transferase component Bud32